MLANSVTPDVAQHGIILVEPVDGGGAKGSRSSRLASRSDQVRNSVAYRLVAAVPNTGPVVIALRLVPVAQFTETFRKPFGDSSRSNLPTLCKMSRGANTGLAQQLVEGSADRPPALRIVAAETGSPRPDGESGPRPRGKSDRDPAAARHTAIRCERDFDRVGAKAHAHSQERTQSRRLFVATTFFKNVSGNPDVPSKSLKATLRTAGTSGLDERSEADRRRTMSSLRLVREHLKDGDRRPPIPTLRGIIFGSAGGRASRPLRASEIKAAAFAIANRDTLRYGALHAAAGRASIGKRHVVDRTPAHRRNAPQQRLPELKPMLPPVGEAARAPALAGARDERTSGVEQQTPRQKRMKMQIWTVGELLERCYEMPSA